MITTWMEMESPTKMTSTRKAMGSPIGKAPIPKMTTSMEMDSSMKTMPTWMEMDNSMNSIKTSTEIESTIHTIKISTEMESSTLKTPTHTAITTMTGTNP